MSTQSFFWIQVAVGAFVLLLILWRRSANKAPTQLQLRKGNAQAAVSRMPAQRSSRMAVSEEVLRETSVGKEKVLNVFFNYNGHCWDAYEILGIPAGAPPAMVESAYKNLLNKTAPESREFIEAAYRAIKGTT